MHTNTHLNTLPRKPKHATPSTNVHFSYMSGKLQGLRSISTNTVTNAFCIKEQASPDPRKICRVCYSHTMLETSRKNAAPALQRNSDLLSEAPLSRAALDSAVVGPDEHYMRIDAHGELINDIHLANIYAIARHPDNQHCTFALWTKRVDLVRRGGPRPENVILIYSNPLIGHIMSKPPRGFDRVFNNVPADMAPERQNCTGQKCMDCLLCYVSPETNDTPVIVEKVKSY